MHIESMGGLARYQAASVAATAAFRTSKFVFQQLEKLGLRHRKGCEKVPGLEIGAINTQLCTCPWLNVRSIDINSQDRRIEQLDFFDVPLPGFVDAEAGTASKPARRLGFIVNAMVINCVPSSILRGEMLARCREHLVPGGLMFLMLPKRCLDASPFMSRSLFDRALACSGFRKILVQRETPKIAMFLL